MKFYRGRNRDLLIKNVGTDGDGFLRLMNITVKCGEFSGSTGHDDELKK